VLFRPAGELGVFGLPPAQPGGEIAPGLGQVAPVIDPAPRQHHKHLKSTNMLERLNEEIKRRTQVIRIFPDAERCLRLVWARAVEAHENGPELHCYLNMEDLREHKKEQLGLAA
jgi:transposase-like protein